MKTLMEINLEINKYQNLIKNLNKEKNKLLSEKQKEFQGKYAIITQRDATIIIEITDASCDDDLPTAFYGKLMQIRFNTIHVNLSGMIYLNYEGSSYQFISKEKFEQLFDKGIEQIKQIKNANLSNL